LAGVVWQFRDGGSLLLSLLFFVASIPFVVSLGYEVFKSRRVSLLGAALFALSPFMNWYGNETRMYSMLVFFTIINQYFFVKVRKSGKGIYWLGYALTAILGAYTHYYFGLVLVTQAIFFLFNFSAFPKYSLRNFIISAIAVGGALAPWLMYVRYLNKISNSEPLLQAPSVVDVFNTFAQFIFGIQSVPINSFIVALWPLVMLAWLFSIKKYGHKDNIDGQYLVFSIISPILIAFVISVLYRPIFEARYLIFTIPALSLLLSLMINSAEKFLRDILTSIIIGSLLISIALVSYNPNTPTKENYQTVATYLDTHANPQDVVIASAPFTIYPLEYYYQGPSSISTLPMWNQYVTGPIPPFNIQTFPTEVQAVVGSHQRAWLLLSYDQGYEKTIRDYFDNHYERLELIQISPGMTLGLYKLRYDTDVSIYKDRTQ
jgi:mannosyltransferase